MIKMKNILFLSAFGVMVSASYSEAHSHKGHKHDHKKSKSLKAHEHGKATIEFALETPQHIKVELKIPGSDAVGFEHKAKSEADRKKVEAYKTQIRTQLMSSLGIESLGCKALEIDVDVDEKGKHSEWEIEGEAHCDQSIVGKTAQVDFSQLMPKLHVLQGSYISEKSQKSLKFENGKGDLTFE